MKTKALIILLCALFSSCNSGHQKPTTPTANLQTYVYWEDMSDMEKNDLLKQSDIDSMVLVYYEGKYKLTDDSITMNLLDSLGRIKEKDYRRPFYFFVMNRIYKESDGAVAEMLGNSCQDFMINNPLYVLVFFQKDKQMLELYAQILGYELYFKEQGTSDIKYQYTDFKKLIEESASKEPQCKEVSSIFFSAIETVMKKMD